MTVSRTRTSSRLLALAGGLLLLLAACSGAEDTDATASEATPTPAATSMPTEPMTEPMTEPAPTETDMMTEDMTETPDTGSAAGDIDIVTALQDAGLGTLATAVQAAGLEDQLANLPEFTVFAPSDDAFIAMGEDLTSMSPTEIGNVLAYHVVEQRLLTSDLSEGENTVPTLAGSDLTITVNGDDVTVGDGAMVTQTDIQVGDKGVIHVIDMVLQPSS